nr:cyclic nucleotide-binding domain-containing protein [Moorena producens]
MRIKDGQLGIGYVEELSLILPTLTDKQLTEIASNIELRTYEPGLTIIGQGYPAKEFYILIEGTVEVINKNDDSEAIVLERLERGNFFGEIGLLKGEKCIENVRVTSDSEAKVMVIDQETFLKMIYESKLTNAVINYQMFQRLSKFKV